MTELQVCMEFMLFHFILGLSSCDHSRKLCASILRIVFGSQITDWSKTCGQFGRTKLFLKHGQVRVVLYYYDISEKSLKHLFVRKEPYWALYNTTFLKNLMVVNLHGCHKFVLYGRELFIISNRC